jgi:hypothetical protein
VSTALATETAFASGRAHEHSVSRLFEPSGSTLEDIVLGAWEDLMARGSAECPVCAGELEVSGCTTCGSELS